MLNRQKILLSLLQESGGQITRLRLMKLCFLLSEESPHQGGKSFYRFVPYKFGPYSFAMSHELSLLARDGYIDFPDNPSIRLLISSEDSAAIPTSSRQDIAWSMERHNQNSTNELLRYVYRRYPWYTMNSVDHFKRRSARPVGQKRVYTLGYEQLSVDGFLSQLIEAGITQVVDVRSNPISRQYGFHKSSLQRLCGGISIKYVHIPELGIPSIERSAITNEHARSELIGAYSKSLAQRADALKTASQLVLGQPSVLMCVEANPRRCHRSALSSQLAEITGLSI